MLVSFQKGDGKMSARCRRDVGESSARGRQGVGKILAVSARCRREVGNVTSKCRRGVEVLARYWQGFSKWSARFCRQGISKESGR